MKINESVENYLECIYVLKDKNGNVRSIDIANELGFSKASVSVAMKNLLEEKALYHNYSLILDSHSECDKYIKTPIKAGVFNLGYLPGSDKKITTLHQTTRIAVEKAINLLAPDGILLIAVYPGHEEGTVEGNMLAEMLSQYNRRKYCCACFRILNSPISPFFYTVESK